MRPHVRVQSAEVRELRGRDEEVIAKAKATGDPVRLLDAILRVGVVSVGDITEQPALNKALDKLLLGDRDLLVMQIRRLAFGDTIRLDVTCPYCDTEFTVDYSFADDVPLKAHEASSDKAQRLFDLETPSGKAVEIALIDGEAQKRVFTPENVNKTGAELNTLMLREVVKSIDGKPVKGVGPILDLPTRDRRYLVDWLGENVCGPQYADVKQECDQCARSFPLVMTLRDMFRGV